MGVTWTEEQRQVIALKNRNILVAAAAGSGKTAVLVERIVQKVLDETDPVDIDRLLVVTFTKAAAAEMRERIGQAIERRMETDPENKYLQRQYTLVNHAQITTIDSFCLYVVRNYFQTVGIEPSFRIADPGELQLLKADVVKEALEAQYARPTEGFMRLVDHYATAKSDAQLVDFVLRLYDFSQSYPWPEEWLSSIGAAHWAETAQQLQEQGWMQELSVYLAAVMRGLKGRMAYAKTLCEDADGPAMYLAAVQDDLAQLEGFLGCRTYEEYRRRFRELSFTKLGVNRKYEGSVEKQEQVKALRKQMKDTLGKLAGDFFYQDTERMLDEMGKTAADIRALSELTLAFAHAYRAKKEEKKIMDFSDIEHHALRILIDEETKEPTAAARELRRMYAEIMVDEYQDSNYVQETILRAVSTEDEGRNNIFMVGDVKQSIYRFRLARPELFTEKYKTYTSEESDRQKIDLYKNFRSRRETLAGINRIFYAIMHEDLGNVEYDGRAALYAGKTDYPEPEQEHMFRTELLLGLLDDGDGEADADGRQEQEARLVAMRIKELLAEQEVTDKETGKLRPARYRDIVILLRSLSGWAETFAKVLSGEGIPVHTTSRTGYFGTMEIRTLLSLLAVIDNPLQDIPFAAVLASPVAGFTGEELARFRTESREHFYYAVLQDYAQYGTDERLRGRAAAFLQMLSELRAEAAYTPVHKLIRRVLQRTGYAALIQAMPDGAQRRANVDMLLEKAAAYEKTSYRGLFHFIRYIEKLRKYEIDFGEADILGEQDDVVRIMSIHKSKGLEFPVCIVSGMGKRFNRQDTRSRMVLHPEYGVGLDFVDSERRIRRAGLQKKALERQLRMENQGEELRVLYVALTRAKEKLIMTGISKEDPPSGAERLLADGQMDFFSRYQADSYLDWVYPVVASDGILYDLRVVSAEELKAQETVEAALNRLDYMQVVRLAEQPDKERYAALDQKLSWQYPFAGDTELKTKISVSELKRSMEASGADEIPAETLYKEEPKKKIPAFYRKDEGGEAAGRGALRGSAVHKVMEEVDFIQSSESVDKLSDIRTQINRMSAKGHITREMRALVSPKLIAGFLEHPLAMRMAAAQRDGVLYKEQPFVMGIPASRVYEGVGDEPVLIQGIVDVYWKEEDGIVILDYKTDSVDRAKELEERYAVQLALYAEALEKATGVPVKETLLYSFHLQEAVPVQRKGDSYACHIGIGVAAPEGTVAEADSGI